MTMSPYILVLAKNTNEGAKYVQRAKLPRGRWRNVASAKSIRGIRKATVHCLPGFSQRPDRHSILAELRYAKCEWIDVVMPEREERIVDQGDGMGPQLTIDDALAAIAKRSFDRTHVVVDSGIDLSDRWADTFYTRTIADRYNRLHDLAEEERALEELSQQPPAFECSQCDYTSDEAGDTHTHAQRRRRPRCSDCGNLHFREEACDDDLVAPIVKPAPAPSPLAVFN